MSDVGYSRGSDSGSAYDSSETLIERRLRPFRFRLRAQCPHCAYQGLMGWDDFKLPMSKPLFVLMLLPLALLGLIPAVIAFFAVQRAKRYSADCPSCSKTLLLKAGDADSVNSSWGGAQFYDADGEKASDRKVFARGGKWVLVGLSALIAVILAVAGGGLALQKLAIAAKTHEEPQQREQITHPPATPAPAQPISIAGTYNMRATSESVLDGGVKQTIERIASFEVVELSRGRMRFSLNTMAAVDGAMGAAHTGEANGEVEVTNDQAVYQYDNGEHDQCKLKMRFSAGKAELQQEHECGFGTGADASGAYVKVSNEIPKLTDGQ